MELFMRFPDYKTKVVTLSYDDGTDFDIKMIEILNKYGIKCTFNLYSKSLFNHDKDWCDVFASRYKDTEHEVACHGMNHYQLANLSTPEIMDEILSDRKNLENAFGCFVNGFAYPNGYRYRDYQLDILKLCGINYGRIVASTHNFELPKNWLTLEPTCHHFDPELFDLVDKFLEPDDEEHYWRIRPQMFYLWGHSYEFGNADRWDLLEEFCQKIGNKDYVWYATNGEIFDYISDFNKIQKTADGNTLYNPTHTDLYFRTHKKLYTLKAGETIKVE